MVTVENATKLCKIVILSCIIVLAYVIGNWVGSEPDDPKRPEPVDLSCQQVRPSDYLDLEASEGRIVCIVPEVHTYELVPEGR